MPVIQTISTETDGRDKYITSVINSAHRSRKNVLRDFIFFVFITINRKPRLIRVSIPRKIRAAIVNRENSKLAVLLKRL